MATEFRIVDSFSEFMELREPWNELVKASDVDHAFMRHEWFACWIKYLGNPNRLFVVTAWQGGRLAAVAPLQVRDEKLKGLPVKVLCFLASSITPRCNFIAAESFDLDELFRFLFRSKGWHLFVAAGMDSLQQPTEKYIEFLTHEKKRGHVAEKGRSSPFLLADSSWEEYYRSLPKKFRIHLNNIQNKLKTTRSFEVRKIDDYGSFSKIFDQLIGVSSRSWKRQMGTDLGSLPQVVSFLDEFNRISAEAALWELWLLEIDGQIACFGYGLRWRTSLSMIRTDFDLAYRYYSPGNNLQLAVLKDLFAREGTWEYDMGGEAYEYKLKWTDRIRQHLNITAANRGVYGQLLMFGKRKILPLVHRLSGGIRS